jgi:hypothetical protein
VLLAGGAVEVEVEGADEQGLILPVVARFVRGRYRS